MIKPTKYPYNPDEMAELFGEAVNEGKQGKQDTLVSGTNIKTINGSSVLGSGDLTVSSAATWGGITGTLSSQTDLNTALNAKQDTLVSGTNIKTVNGNSLLGSGDVAVQPTLVSGTNIKTVNGNSLLGSGNLTISGGGLQGVHALTAIPTGFNYGYSASLTALNSNGAFNTNTSALILAPFIPARNITYTSLKINVTTATASCLTRILIYSDNNGLPSTKLFESSSIDCSTTGNKTITITGTFTAGTTYWIGTHANNNCVLSGIPVGSAVSVGISLITAGHITGWNYAYTFNTAPATLNQAQRSNWTGPIQLIQILP